MKNLFKHKKWTIILPIGIIMLVIGLIQDGYRDTLSKAIKICLECIGIG